MGETRAVCLNCIDGRAQLPVIHWAQQQLKVDHVDMITEPGIDGLLADQNYSMEVINWKVGISIEKNNANGKYLQKRISTVHKSIPLDPSIDSSSAHFEQAKDELIISFSYKIKKQMYI